VRKKEYAVSVT